MPLSTHAATLENLEYQWSKVVGNSGYDDVSALTLDADGNIYITGLFEGTDIDLNPGAGTDLHTSVDGFLSSQDAFISKFNPDGSFAWAKSFGGEGEEIPFEIVTDSEGDIYVIGYFNGEDADFDASAAQALRSGPTEFDQQAFIVKYESDGSFAWVRAIGGTGTDIAFDAVFVDDNVYVGGTFQGTDVDFDDAGGTDTHTASGTDSFLTKYAADGSYSWTKTWTASGLQGVALGSDGNIRVAGYFSGSNIDFDPTGSTDAKTSAGNNDVYLTTYAQDGTYIETMTFGGSGDESPSNIAMTADDDVYFIGEFDGTNIDFDNTAGTDTHSSDDTNGEDDIFITKYNSDGSYGWTRRFGGAYDDDPYVVEVDSEGNIYFSALIECFEEVFDLDPTDGEDQLDCSDDFDYFATISKYSSTGTYLGSGTIKGDLSSTDGIYGIDIDENDTIYLGGAFGADNVDLDLTSGTDIYTAGGFADAFFSKYTKNTAAPTQDSGNSGNSSSGGGGGDSDFSDIVEIGKQLKKNVSVNTPTLVSQAKRKESSLNSPIIETAAGEKILLTTKVPDADRAQSVILRAFGKIFVLKASKYASVYQFNGIMPNAPGTYPYTLTINYGSTTLSEKGTFNVGSPDAHRGSILPKLNSVFSLVYGRDPNFSEWSYWATRIIAGEKKSLPELFGAIQWQQAFGD